MRHLEFTTVQNVDDNGNIYYEISISPFAYDDPKYFNKIEAYLTANAIVFNGISVKDDTLVIYVPNLADEVRIRSLAENFQNVAEQPTPRENAINNAIGDMLTLVKAISTKPRNQRTDAEKIALGLALYVGLSTD